MENLPQSRAQLADPTAITAHVLLECYNKLQDIEDLRQSGDPDKLNEACALCEDLVRQVPDYWGAQHTLGLIYTDLENFQRALDCLTRAAMMSPSSVETLTALSNIYVNLDAFEMAEKTIQSAIAIAPDAPSALCMLGEVYKAQQNFSRASDAYRQAILIDPDLMPAIMGLGNCLFELGQVEEAAAVFESVVNRDPEMLDPLYKLSSLPPSVVKVDILRGLDNVKQEGMQSTQEFDIFLNLTKAAALRSAQRHTEAWSHFVQANRAIFHDKRQDYKEEKKLQSLSMAALENFDASITSKPALTPDVPVSLFILGPSRSGKTSLEYILSGCDAVKRGYESTIIERVVKDTMQDAGLPGCTAIELLPRQLRETFCESYVRALKKKAEDKSIYSITNPRLIKHAAGILSIVPNARMILMRRDIDDNVFRVYIRQYLKGHFYSYNLNAARDHINWYNAMIDLVAKKFPALVRVIRYEDILENRDAVLDEVAELCGTTLKRHVDASIGDDRGCSIAYIPLMAAETVISMI